jgi:hypothetical protein
MATGVECGIVAGEYVAYDPANLDTARNFWREEARKGDPKAKNYLGEIYERGLGTERDYREAAKWYREAAEDGFAAAQFNLGQLYELGLGVERDPEEALSWYRRASGLPTLAVDAALQDEPVLTSPVTATGAPQIRLLDPLVAETRGITVVPTASGVERRAIVGRVEAQAPVRSLTVNDASVPTQSSGLFETSVALAATGTAVNIVAVDAEGRRGERSFRLHPSAAPSDRSGFGSFHALVIGIDNYEHLQPLATPRRDAEVIAKLLAEQYGFTVTSLPDATREQIMRALNTLNGRLTDADNLLIYYAGHGQLDQLNTRGNWLPKDADSTDTTNWIPNTAITDILNHMRARGVLVVADSCYAGTLLRSDVTSMTVDVEILRRKRSRTALTSGGLEPVLDDGSNGHSVFANAFIDALQKNSGVLDAQQLLLQIRAKVAEAANERNVEQVPLHGAINLAGHQNGAFFFVPTADSAFVAAR